MSIWVKFIPLIIDKLANYVWPVMLWLPRLGVNPPVSHAKMSTAGVVHKPPIHAQDATLATSLKQAPPRVLLAVLSTLNAIPAPRSRNVSHAKSATSLLTP